MNKLPSQATSKNSWKRWLPGLVVSAIVIYVLYRLIDIDTLFGALKKTNYLYVGIAFILMVLANLSRAAAWRELLGRRIHLKDAFCIVNEGYLLNQIIPRSGEVGRALLVNSAVQMNFFETLSTIIIERAIDLGIAAIMFLSTVGNAIAMDWITPVAITILGVVLAGFLFLFWAIRKQETVIAWLDRADQRSRFFRTYISPNLKAIIKGAQVIQDPKRILLAVLFIALCWTMWISVSFILLTSFIGSQPFWKIVFMQSILSFGIALPSAPAGLGVYEGTLVAALSVFSVEKETALSFAIIMHAVQLVTIAALGIISLAAQGNSLSTLIGKVFDRLKKKE
jgi:uncharacterized protein (TIRG00374 family)